MRKYSMMFAAGALALLGACSRSANGDADAKRQSDANGQVAQDTLHMPAMTTATDTVTAPVIGAQPDTMVVNKPVAGTPSAVTIPAKAR